MIAARTRHLLAGLDQVRPPVVSATVHAEATSAGTTLPAYTCNKLFQLTVPSGHRIERLAGVSADGHQVVGILGKTKSGDRYAATRTSESGRSS